jgi:hypothetical protein
MCPSCHDSVIDLLRSRDATTSPLGAWFASRQHLKVTNWSSTPARATAATSARVIIHCDLYRSRGFTYNRNTDAFAQGRQQ